MGRIIATYGADHCDLWGGSLRPMGRIIATYGADATRLDM